MSRPLDERAQRRALTRAFLARFFENEITRGTHDLKASFAALLAAVSIPLAFLPAFIGAWPWSFIARYRGIDYLRDYTLGDKLMVVGVGMVVTGVIGALVWNSVLVDRRDAMIVGALPVPARAVVRAKLAALFAYVTVLAAAMAALASPVFGLLLASGDAARAATGTVAHFVAAFSASAFVLLAVAASQALLLLAVGPRRARRWSAGLQLLLVGATILLLLFLPAIGEAARDAYRADWPSYSQEASTIRLEDRTWLRWLPPVWFLGVYETIIVPHRPVALPLAATAAAALGGVAVLTVAAVPLACRRVMAAAVEEPDGVARTGRVSEVAAWWTRVVHRTPAARASSQFLLAALGRVDRHRFVMAVAAGVAAAWVLPTALRWLTLLRDPPSSPEGGLLQAPYAVMLCMLLGLRVAAALPASLPPGWLLTLVDVPRRTHRSVLRRTMVGLVVLPTVIVLLPAYWGLWGAQLALTHAALVVGVGAVLANLLLWGVDAMPCGRAWEPVNARLRLWWPVYLLSLGIYTQLWRLSVALAPRPASVAAVVTALAGAAILLGRIGGRGLLPARYDSDQDPATLQVLDLQ